MAPKKAPKPKDVGPTLVQYCEVLKGTPLVNEATNKPVKKAEAALQLWSAALKGEGQREEIFKAQCVPNLVKLADVGDASESYAAMGVLSVIILSEKHIAEVVSKKLINAATALLAGEHDRAKIPAAQFLAYIAQRADYANKVADAALPTLTSVLLEVGPGWAQTPALQVASANAIKALVENVAGENPDVKVARRLALLQAGAVPVLVAFVCAAPRLPRPDVFPVPPPATGKKGKGKASGAKGKKGKTAAPPPAGIKDAVATSASALLRFLASCPGFVEAMNACNALPELVDVVATAGDVRTAYVCGILWEVCADEAVARAAVACGAVPALLHAASRFVSAAGSGSKKKSGGTKKGGEKEKKPKAPEGPPPINYADMAVCNACGALHHLTFLDEAKAQVGEVGIAILVAAKSVGNPQTYENATGALWNVGLDARNTSQLAAAAAPAFLVEPVPSTWLTESHAAFGSDADESEGECTDDDDGGARGPSNTFITAHYATVR